MNHPMRDSVHDNGIYAQAAGHERRRVVLHTVWPHAGPPEYTDIVFDGVVVHHFEQQKVSSGPYPANVLFDVGKTDPLLMLGQYGGWATAGILPPCPRRRAGRPPYHP